MRWPWQKANQELDLEVRYHLESLADGFERQGMSRDEAMRRARAEFGGVEVVKDACRDESRWNWILQIGQDVRFGWRMMRKTPAITAAAVLTLALGIGATTAILTLADTVLWRPLAVPAPEQLSEILWTSLAPVEDLYQMSAGGSFTDGGARVFDFFSRRAYEAIRERGAGKAEVAGHISSPPVSTGYGGSLAVAKVRGVTGNFFRVLQVQPFAGRLLMDADDRAGAQPAAVVTHRFWRSHLEGTVDAVGKTMLINNVPYAIAGVLPPAFSGLFPGDGTDLYTPMEQSPQLLRSESYFQGAATNPKAWYMQLLARRAPGVSEQALAGGLDAAFAGSWAAQPKSPEATPRLRLARAANGLGALRSRVGDPVLALLGLVALVLLVACANIANLLLARAAGREKESALRVSLGCGEGRLMRQFFTETSLLAGMGGALSLFVAAGLGTVMRMLLPPGMDGLQLAPETDLRAWAGTAAVTVVAALLAGLFPAWRAARVNAAPALKEGGGSSGTAGPGRWAAAKGMVLVQVAFGVLLVAAAIVFVTRLQEVSGRETGFERGHLLLFDVRPGEVGYRGERLRQFYLQLEERLGGLAGVASVGLAWTRPMRGGGYSDDVQLAGRKDSVIAAIHHGNAAFVGALGVPILAGRAMTAQEARAGAKVAVIGEDLAKALGAEAPVGVRVRSGRSEFEVIGVARRARYSDMERNSPVAYLPFDYEREGATVVVRTTLPPTAVFGAVREAMRGLDKDLPLIDVLTMEEQISRTVQRERIFAWLCGSFGVLALVLCAVGLYGLMAHTTARRTGEIGVRMALGATRSDVMGQVFWEGLRLAGTGVLLGVPLATAAARAAAFFQLLPAGAMPFWTLTAAVGVLAMAAVVAVLGPALRASSVDPMQALRD